MGKRLGTLAVALVAACGGGDASLTVFRSLGSAQCTGGGTTTAALQDQLVNAGVSVLLATCGLDGITHPTVCGAPDGRIAVFDIPVSQQAVAEVLGFALLSTLPSAAVIPCP